MDIDPRPKRKREAMDIDPRPKRENQLLGIPGLVDAKEAGTIYSDKCTLILTAGNSVKFVASKGRMSKSRKKYYGIFPLGGKLLNVREATQEQIAEDAEIQHIVKILGLQQGKVYDTVDSLKSLRYGRLMMMTNQHHDGSRIKGLVINLIHFFWPSLLKISCFLLEFITPKVKATNIDGGEKFFYTILDYESWMKNLGDKKNWTINHYKWLGHSTRKEAKKYFQNLKTHQRSFTWVDETDGDVIDMAFSQKRIEERKTWIQKFESGTCLDDESRSVGYRDFVTKLMRYSLEDMPRSIPSMVDGLNPVQREILSCACKVDLVTRTDVSLFLFHVLNHCAYQYDYQTLTKAIVGMAQDFVGTNNINLFNPEGHFGSRVEGPKYHEPTRHLCTNLTPIAELLFPKIDDILFHLWNKDGQPNEYTWYAPVIPLVLVNRCQGIGTGWSTSVPSYNPEDLCANVRRLLKNEPMVPIHPWYKGFQGTIEGDGVCYTTTGKIKFICETTYRITELPVHTWIKDYEEFLHTLSTCSGEIEEPFIKEYAGYRVIVFFQIAMSKQSTAMKEEELIKKLKLTSTISTNNMHLFDPKGVLKKYDNPEHILQEFFKLRLHLYTERREKLLKHFGLELLKIDYKLKVISFIRTMDVSDVAEWWGTDYLVLKKKGSLPHTDYVKVDEEQVQSIHENLMSSTNFAILIFKKKDLLHQQSNYINEKKQLESTTAEKLWEDDLDALENKLIELRKEATAEDEFYSTVISNKVKIMMKEGTSPKEAGLTADEVSSVVDLDNVSETVKSPRKGVGGGRKAPAEKHQQKPTVVDSDEDSEILAGEVTSLRICNAACSH